MKYEVWLECKSYVMLLLSFELLSFFLAHVLLFNPALSSLTSAYNQLITIVIVQLILTHLFDSRFPELMLYKQLYSQILVWDFTQCILSKLTVTSITENLTHSLIWNWRVLHLQQLGDFRSVL